MLSYKIYLCGVLRSTKAFFLFVFFLPLALFFLFLFRLITMSNSIQTERKQNWTSSFSAPTCYKFCIHVLGLTTIFFLHVCDLLKLKTLLFSMYSRYILVFLSRQVNGSTGFHSVNEASLWNFFCTVLLYSCLVL